MIEASEILKILKSGDPVSLIRYGDGEAGILHAWKDMPNFKAILKRQLGYIPNIEHAEQIRANLIEAYQNCDIIGIPAERHIRNGGYWTSAVQMMIDNVGRDILESKKLTTVDVASQFLDNNYFEDLLRGQKVVNYISCRKIDEEMKSAFGIEDIYSFRIAPEAKFTSGYVGEPHYPDQFKAIRKWIHHIPVEGNVCLVGAGYIGKIYCNWFRERGGIAFDIGAVFDSFAGLATRGPQRGLDAKDETFKL